MQELEQFDEWNEIKKNTHLRNNIVGYKEREIFWTRIGYNIGSEEYGKGNEFQRPVIIIKKKLGCILHNLYSIFKWGNARFVMQRR